MYAQRRFDVIGGTGEGFRLRGDARLPAGLPALGRCSLEAANGVCRLRTEAVFEDAWPIGGDWVVTAGDCQLAWPARCWRHLLALPAGERDFWSLHCLAAVPAARLTLSPGGHAEALALERLICRHLHPRQQPAGRVDGPAGLRPRPVAGEAVAPETLPSVFTLAWARGLSLNLVLPLGGAALHCQGLPSPPRWRGAQCRLSLGRQELSLDCLRLGGVVRQRRDPGRGRRDCLVLLDEDGAPLLEIGCDAAGAWRRLLGEVLYSPRGATLSK